MDAELRNVFLCPIRRVRIASARARSDCNMHCITWACHRWRGHRSAAAVAILVSSDHHRVCIRRRAWGRLRGRSKAPRSICWILIICGLVGFAATQWVWGGYAPAPWHRTAIPRTIYLGVPALLVVAGAVLDASPTNGWSGIRKLCARLGDASYSIYLLHPLVGFAVITWNLRPANIYVGIAVDFAFLLPASLATYTWFERPMQRLVRLLLTGRGISPVQRPSTELRSKIS